jgi:hypothetical protein
MKVNQEFLTFWNFFQNKTRNELIEKLAIPLMKNGYGEYLLNILKYRGRFYTCKNE